MYSHTQLTRSLLEMWPITVSYFHQNTITNDDATAINGHNTDETLARKLFVAESGELSMTAEIVQYKETETTGEFTP